MPQERTTTSFALAAAAAVPLSSHGPLHIPSLRRGGACLVCRTRRIKCDGLRPACSTCQKSASVHGDDPASIVCDYDTKSKPSSRTQVEVDSGKLAELELENERLKRALADATSRLDYSATFNSTPAWSPPDLLISGLESSLCSAPSNTNTPPGDPLFEIFYPGWPPDLPSPMLVDQLIDVYFTRPHPASGMIDQAVFRANMRLPPSHYFFPHTSTIHAVLATAARLVSKEFFYRYPKYWGAMDVKETVVDYHMKRAEASLHETMTCSPSKLYSVFQAVVLMCFNSYLNAEFLGVWNYSGMAMRFVTPLGLNHIRNGAPCPGEELLAPVAYGTTAESEEVVIRERAMMFWLAVSCDKFASASTGWSCGIDDRDITSLLPAPKSSGLPEDLFSSPLSPGHPDFLTVHPHKLVRPLQLYFKAVVLLGRVVEFLQRMPPPIGNGLPKPPGDTGAAEAKAFEKLHNDCVSFRLSIPRGQQLDTDPASDSAATYGLLVDAVSHTATILLHEPFCSNVSHDFSLFQCLASARAILEGIHKLVNTSLEITSLPPSITFCWAVCGRTFVRALAVADASNVQAIVNSTRLDTLTVIDAMRAYRCPLGDAAADALLGLLQSPKVCLPSEDIRRAATGVGFSEATDALKKAKFKDKAGSQPSTSSFSFPGPSAPREPELGGVMLSPGLEQPAGTPSGHFLASLVDLLEAGSDSGEFVV